MANPKGHLPSIEKYKFKSTKQEPCDAHLSVRIPSSLLKQLKELDNWQDFVRNTLKEALSAKSS